MFLKLLLFTILLNCVVLASCEELKEISSKQAPVDETLIEEIVESSTIDNLEITDPLNEDLENIESVSTNETTTTTFIDTEVSTNSTNDLVATTVLDNTDNYDNTTDNTDISGDNTELITEHVTEIITNEATENITAEVSEIVTAESTENITEESNANSTNVYTEIVTEEPTVNVTGVSTETIAEKSSVTEDESTTSTTTEPPTTPFDILCPQVPETDIDPKYRNETFELHLAEFMKENPLAKIYKSPGFPAPYAENLNCTLSVTLPNCTGIDVVIHYLDLNPFEPDTLNIRGGDEHASKEKGKKLTGEQVGIVYKIIHTTSLYIWFNSGPVSDGYRGFLLTYSPYGNDTLPPTTTETPITIPPSEVQFYEVQLIVPENIRTNVTWQKIKEVLAGSASKYVTEQSLNYELAHSDNVTMDIFNCPNNWPNYKTCVRLQFSIAVWSLDFDPDVQFDVNNFAYELSTNSLSVMWDLYGRDDFAEILKIQEYSVPDGTYILLLWTGVSVTIVVIFIGVLYSIWRIDIFREYRRMYTKSDDQQDILKDKSELDISMYPIPHQPYPTLFETNEINSGGYYDLHEINSTSFHQGHSFHSEIQKSSSNYQNSGNHFSPNIIDFNDTQLFPDDEDDFGRVQSLSPRSKQKLLVLGAKRDESNT